MKRLLVLLTACVWASGCDSNNGTRSDVMPQASEFSESALGAVAVDDVLEDVALLLANTLADPDARRAVHTAVSERFNGAPEVLFRDLLRQPVKGSTFREALLASIIRTRGVSRADAVRALGRLASVSARLDVAVPVRLAEWDPEAYAPLVTFEPTALPEDEVVRLEAYDSSGNPIYLDAQTPPDRPVIVIGLNERTDESGNVRQEFLLPAGTNLINVNPLQDSGGQTSFVEPVCNPEEEACSGGGGSGGGGGGTTPTMRQGSHPETLERIVILNDYEIWYQEPAEIRTMVACPGVGVVFASLLGDPEPEREWLYAGKEANGTFRYERNLSDLYTRGIHYFNWDPNVISQFCGHELYEDDGGGTTTVTSTFPNPSGGPGFTISSTRPVNNVRMGTVSILYSNSLNQTYGTFDFQIDMK